VKPEEARNKIADLVAGHLDEETAREVRAALLTDEATREFYEQVRHLYRVDLEPGEALEAPEGLRYDYARDAARAARSRWLRSLCVAAALLLLAGAAFFVLRSPEREGDPADGQVAGGGGIEAPAPEPLPPVPLLPVEIELPPLPDGYHAGEWLESREQATLVSLYSGRPVIESYVNPYCPISQDVWDELGHDRNRSELDGFVCYYERYDGKVPEPIRGQVDPRDIIRMLPALHVSGQGCPTETYFGVSCFDDVRGHLADFEKRCRQRGSEPERFLSEREFEASLAAIHEAASRAEAGRLGEALRALDTVLESERSRSTAFGEAASEVAARIHEAIERQIDAIENLAGDPAESLRARDLACRFVERVRDTRYEARVRALCET